MHLDLIKNFNDLNINDENHLEDVNTERNHVTMNFNPQGKENQKTSSGSFKYKLHDTEQSKATYKIPTSSNIVLNRNLIFIKSS